MKKYGYFWLLFILCIQLTACSLKKKDNSPPLSVLRIGILPDEDKQKLLNRYTPLFKYLSEEIGIPYELTIPESYDELLNLFNAKKIDLAYFGGFTFMKAHLLSNAVPLVVRDIDTRFTSYFLIHGDSSAKKISEFKGKTLSFGSRLSTSGHLMPRYFLKEQNIVPEKFFSDVLYSGAHDRTAVRVRDKSVDIGVANSQIVNSMFKDGRLKKGDVRVIWETPPYYDYVWALQPVYGKNIKIKISDAFFDLSNENTVHAKILKLLNAGSFMPAHIKDFYQLQSIVSALEITG